MNKSLWDRSTIEDQIKYEISNPTKLILNRFYTFITVCIRFAIPACGPIRCPQPCPRVLTCDWARWWVRSSRWSGMVPLRARQPRRSRKSWNCSSRGLSSPWHDGWCRLPVSPKSLRGTLTGPESTWYKYSISLTIITVLQHQLVSWKTHIASHKRYRISGPVAKS